VTEGAGRNTWLEPVMILGEKTSRAGDDFLENTMEDGGKKHKSSD
jgi:hypothetical protein